MRKAQIVRMVLVVFALFIIFGPLSGLVIWSVAEKWYWPHLLPQQVGTFYWAKVFQGRMGQALEVGVLIAFLVTGLSLLFTVPLAYVLARFNVPFKAVVLMIFMLPQAFPQLPVFVNATVYLYRLNLAGRVPGVVLIHMVGALVYAVWTMTAVFKSIPVSLEEAAMDLGATYWGTLLRVTLPICFPAILAAFLTSFTTSFDEFAVSFFLAGTEPTLPVYLYSQLRFPNRLPIVVTLAAIVMVGSTVVLVLSEWLRRKGQPTARRGVV